MAKLFGLDIPDGLEQLFAAVLQLKPNGDVNGVGLTLPKQNFERARRTANRSLIILWQPLFDSFDLDRRNAWHAYWGGWPGSGFSAFIQINAPLYKAGLDLLLDPPSANIVANGSFTPDNVPWDFEDEPNCSWSDGFAFFNAYPALLEEIMLQGVEGTVHVSFNAIFTNGGRLTLFTPDDNTLLFDGSVVEGVNSQTRTLVGGGDDSLAIFSTDFIGTITDVKITLS